MRMTRRSITTMTMSQSHPVHPENSKCRCFFCLLLLFLAVIVEMDSIWMDTGRFKRITEEEEV